MKSIFLILLLCLPLTGCGRQWERFWGQDTKPEREYIPLRPGMVEAEVIGDCFWVIMDNRLLTAKYMHVWAVDGADVAVPLPYYDTVSGKTAMVVRDLAPMYPGMTQKLWFVDVHTALPGAVKIRIEFVN